MIEYAVVWVMGVFLKVMETVCEIWNEIKQYEETKR